MFKKILKIIFCLLNTNVVVSKYTKEQQIKDQYNDYLRIHNKKYLDENEYNNRLNIFYQNLQKIKHYRDGDKLCKMYLDKNSDLEIGKFYDSCKQ